MSNDVFEDLHCRIRDATIQSLKKSWPTPSTISPNVLGIVLRHDFTEFIEVIQYLIDHGMITVEILIIGAGDEPVARDVTLTHKGAAANFDL